MGYIATEGRPTGCLDGLRVVELSQRRVGALCAKILADLGAEVVALEPPDGHPERTDDIAFAYLASGKQSLVLDSVEQLVAVVSEADVLIDDLDHDHLTDLDAVPLEGLVRCSIRPFGACGPFAAFRSTHLTTFHAGGEGHLLPSGLGWTMFPDRPPLQIGADAGDHDAAALAAVAILGALHQRARTGVGQRIDISEQEAQLTLNRTRLSRFNNDGIVVRRIPTPYPIGGMLTCLDGYVQLVGLNDQHWEALASSPGADDLVAPPLDTKEGRASNLDQCKERLAAWCSQLPRARVVDILGRAGCAIGAYLQPAELPDVPQLRHRGYFQKVQTPAGRCVELPGVPYRFSRTPVRLRAAPPLGSFTGFTARTADTPVDRSSRPGAWSPHAPLAGVRVVDFTWAAAGPYATLLLALLGAEVIKIEARRRPDLARRGFMADYGDPELSPNFNELNLNKLGMTVDLSQPQGRELVERLISMSDVVVENFRPGVLTRLGFAPEQLVEDHPGLIVASSSANGSEGPESRSAGLASIFGATGGLSEQTGYPDGPATEIGESTDYRSGNYLTVAILAALRHRQASGHGQFIDLSSREVAATVGSRGILAALSGEHRPIRLGNRHATMAPHGVYRCAGDDEWIAVAIEDDEMWVRCCTVVGRPDLQQRFPTAAERKANEDELDVAIEQWTSVRAPADAFQALQQAEIASAPSFTADQLRSDPHLVARAIFVDVEHPRLGRQTVMRAPWRMSAAACGIERHGPLLGQDNEYVLTEILGLSQQEADQYRTVLS